MPLRHLDPPGFPTLSRGGSSTATAGGVLVAAWLLAVAPAGARAAVGAHREDRRATAAKPAAKAPPAAGPAAASGGGEEEVEAVDLGAGGDTGDKGEGMHANADALMGDDYPRMDRIFDHQTAQVVRPRTFETLIGHRNYEGALQRPFRDLLGFDGGSLKVMLGVRYGIMDILDVGVARMNRTFERYTTWELDTKVQIFRQKNVGLDVAVRLGLDVFESPDALAAGVLTQVLVSRTLADRALLGAGVLFSNASSGQYKRDSDPPNSAAIMVEAELRVTESLSLAAELTYAVAGFAERWPVITYGPKFITNRHTFSIVVSNSQYTTADSLVTNTYRSNWRDWLLGFHITREI